MPTKLSELCNRIIEACWLAVLIVTPLFFNSFSYRSFEPDKAVMLRSLALLVVLAWLIKGIEYATTNRLNYREILNLPFSLFASIRRWNARQALLIIPVFLLIHQAIASTFSIAPNLSLLGSYHRLQGLYTTAAYLVFFFSLVALLRSREQLERIITTILMVSYPVALYGIIQYLGLDPATWESAGRSPVRSTLGNEIFIAAFLIMVVPLTLYRLIATGQCALKDDSTLAKSLLVLTCIVSLIALSVGWLKTVEAGTLASITILVFFSAVALLRKRRVFPLLLCGTYLILLATQLLCVFLSESRGPFIGLVTGVIFFGLALSIIHQKRGTGLVILGSALAFIILVVSISLPGSPFGFIRDMPVLGRLTGIFESTGSVHVRILIWNGIAKLMEADLFRTLIGYGPETMSLVFPPYSHPDLGTVVHTGAIADRAHNETFDIVLSSGLIGLWLYYMLIISALYLGQKWTGIIGTCKQRNIYFFFCLGSAISTTILTYIIDHSWRFLGLSLPLGILVGLLLYVSYLILFQLRRQDTAKNTTWSSERILIIALLSGILAHFVEIHVGIAIITTYTYFWTFIAMLAVALKFNSNLSRNYKNASVEAYSDRQAVISPTSRPSTTRNTLNLSSIVTASILAGLILATIDFNFPFPNFGQAQHQGIIWLYLLTFTILGIVIFSLNNSKARQNCDLRAWIRNVGIYGSICSASLLTLSLAKISHSYLRPNIDPTLYAYFSTLLLAILFITLSLQSKPHLTTQTRGILKHLLYITLTVCTLILLNTTNLAVIQADILFKKGWFSYHQKGRYDQALILYNQALELTPNEDFYHIFLGKAFFEKGQKIQNTTEKEQLFSQSEDALLKAHRTSPTNPEHLLNLARLQQIWAMEMLDNSDRVERLRKARIYYRLTTEYAPNKIQAWNELGIVHTLLHEYNLAAEIFQHSLSLNKKFFQSHLLLGELYRTQKKWDEAAKAYEQAVANKPNSIEAHLVLGFTYAQAGRLLDAIRENEISLTLSPRNLHGHRNLILLHWQMGNCDQALIHAANARNLLPKEQDIRDLELQLQQTCDIFKWP